MSSRAVARILFTVATISLCAVVLIQSQALSAHAEAADEIQDVQGERVPARIATSAGPAPQPLRWQVDFAVKSGNATYNNFCATSVVGRNLSPSALTSGSTLVGSLKRKMAGRKLTAVTMAAP